MRSPGLLQRIEPFNRASIAQIKAAGVQLED
jgi:hypothetical protein